MMQKHLLRSLMSAALMFGATGTAMAATPMKTMPKELLGNWHEPVDYNPPVCHDGDDGLLQVTTKEFTFPLSVGRILSVTEVETDRYRVDFMEQELSETPKPTRPVKRTEYWTLSHDGEHLLVNDNGEQYDLFRCKPQAK